MTSGSVGLSLWQRRNVRVLEWQKVVQLQKWWRLESSPAQAGMSNSLHCFGSKGSISSNAPGLTNSELNFTLFLNICQFPWSRCRGPRTPERDSRGSNSWSGRVQARFTQTLAFDDYRCSAVLSFSSPRTWFTAISPALPYF